MKILTLLEIVQTTKQDSKFNGYLGRNGGVNPNTERLGNGFFSTVKDSKTDPHLVKKYNHKPNNAHKDGYNVYINYLIDHDYLNNPYFPRVYNVKKITDKNDVSIYKYDMEKLTKSMDITVEEITTIIENTINEQYHEELFRKNEWRIKPARNLDIIENLVWLFERCIKNGAIAPFKDETLAKAIKILFEVHMDTSMKLDLGQNNIMWRRTPYGMHLVFTDPFGYAPGVI